MWSALTRRVAGLLFLRSGVRLGFRLPSRYAFVLDGMPQPEVLLGDVSRNPGPVHRVRLGIEDSVVQALDGDGEYREPGLVEVDQRDDVEGDLREIPDTRRSRPVRGAPRAAARQCRRGTRCNRFRRAAIWRTRLRLLDEGNLQLPLAADESSLCSRGQRGKVSRGVRAGVERTSGCWRRV